MKAQNTAVLLMAYGGPETLEDVPAYLQDVRNGKPTPQSLLAEVTERYRLIGGRSPLREITERVACKLSDELQLPVHVGMRHWHPYIRDVVREMVAKHEVRRIVGICMAPHYSRMSIGMYRRRLEEAIAATGEPVELRFVPQWHTAPHYIQGLTATVQQALDRFDEEERAQVRLLFTAHSLPAAILDHGDPYDRQVRETALLVAERLRWPADHWMVCYQSAPRSPTTPWLGPQLDETIDLLAQAGVRSILVAPIGFLAEHVEILYDIDIAAKRLANQLGVRLERAPMLNDRPELIAALKDLVQEALSAKEASQR
ncbi:MAG: ferrochelatase [Anaerolineae bacterium]